MTYADVTAPGDAPLPRGPAAPPAASSADRQGPLPRLALQRLRERDGLSPPSRLHHIARWGPHAAGCPRRRLGPDLRRPQVVERAVGRPRGLAEAADPRGLRHRALHPAVHRAGGVGLGRHRISGRGPGGEGAPDAGARRDDRGVHAAAPPGPGLRLPPRRRPLRRRPRLGRGLDPPVPRRLGARRHRLDLAPRRGGHADPAPGASRRARGPAGRHCHFEAGGRDWAGLLGAGADALRADALPGAGGAAAPQAPGAGRPGGDDPAGVGRTARGPERRRVSRRLAQRRSSAHGARSRRGRCSLRGCRT